MIQIHYFDKITGLGINKEQEPRAENFNRYLYAAMSIHIIFDKINNTFSLSCCNTNYPTLYSKNRSQGWLLRSYDVLETYNQFGCYGSCPIVTLRCEFLNTTSSLDNLILCCIKAHVYTFVGRLLAHKNETNNTYFVYIRLVCFID